MMPVAPAVMPSSRRTEFFQGVKDTIPMIAGAIPFGILFGVLGVGSGLSPLAVAGLSLFVYAGSSQFIGVQLIQQQVGLAVIIITTFIVNLRHALYAASLSPYVKHLPQRWIVPMAFWLTDETYAVVIRRYQEKADNPYQHWYYLGSALAMYLNWQIWTWIGMFAGSQLQGLENIGLDFAMVVTFIGIVVPIIRTRPMLACAVVAGIVSVLTADMPNKAGLMVAAFTGIAAGMLAESQTQSPDRALSEA